MIEEAQTVTEDLDGRRLLIVLKKQLAAAAKENFQFLRIASSQLRRSIRRCAKFNTRAVAEMVCLCDHPTWLAQPCVLIVLYEIQSVSSEGRLAISMRVVLIELPSLSQS